MYCLNLIISPKLIRFFDLNVSNVQLLYTLERNILGHRSNHEDLNANFQRIAAHQVEPIAAHPVVFALFSRLL